MSPLSPPCNDGLYQLPSASPRLLTANCCLCPHIDTTWPRHYNISHIITSLHKCASYLVGTSETVQGIFIMGPLVSATVSFYLHSFRCLTKQSQWWQHNEVRQCDTFLIEIYTGGDPGSWALGRAAPRYCAGINKMGGGGQRGVPATRMLARAGNDPSGSFHSAQRRPLPGPSLC